MENGFCFTGRGGPTVNRIDVSNVDTFRTGSFSVSEPSAAGDAASNARSWRGLREHLPAGRAAPPRTVGVKE
ncbi:hypothetical protein Aiant_42500 [Actinoplanes ianthinogenes]|uniref:Uncharacterized protein n=1 Tax=Actinoplanes ianthinogenes TaxID=122358 RepID=A0ABM7LW81_9ACTN|nr:hypothetical protein Aiant_42500 [Actinoplanes ianthinogenes]